jgi:hypothetical protein
MRRSARNLALPKEAHLDLSTARAPRSHKTRVWQVFQSVRQIKNAASGRRQVLAPRILVLTPRPGTPTWPPRILGSGRLRAATKGCPGQAGSERTWRRGRGERLVRRVSDRSRRAETRLRLRSRERGPPGPSPSFMSSRTGRAVGQLLEISGSTRTGSIARKEMLPDKSNRRRAWPASINKQQEQPKEGVACFGASWQRYYRHYEPGNHHGRAGTLRYPAKR